MKANSASVDTQKTWQLNFVLTNGKSKFQPSDYRRHRNGSLYDRRNYDHGRSGNASYICDPQKQKIGSFRKKRKKFRTENRQRKGRKTNRERKRQKEKGLSVCAKKRKSRKRHNKRGQILTPVIFLTSLLLFAAGVGIFIYPALSNYLAQREQKEVIEEYAQTVEQIDKDKMARQWELAEEYNETLLGDPVHDPFIPGTGYALSR